MATEWYHPMVDSENAPFWKAAREGKLLIKRCTSCKKDFYYPRGACPHCWSDKTEWKEASRKGTIYSYSVVHQNPAPPFKELCPYGVLLVDLEEGPRMMVNWDFKLKVDQLKVGMPVEIAFRVVNEDLSLPIARPR